jgi:hypothetical protein
MSDKPEQESTLKKAAKAIGTIAGSVAAVAGVHAAPARKSGRFPKTNKARLPRREKKIEKKKLAHAHNKA